MPIAPLAPAPAWTPIAPFATTVIISGPPNFYEILTASAPPAPSAEGLPVRTFDGIVETGGMDGAETLYARPYGTDAPISLRVYTSGTGELWTTNTERERNVRCALSGSTTTAQTQYYGFIDLSDTVNWPHDSTGRLDFSYLSVLLDKAASARGTMALGIITRINATNADITYLAASTFLQNDTASFEVIANFAPSQIKAEVAGGSLTHIKTNNIAVNVAAVNTATPLAFGAGGPTFTPAVGDAIVRIVTTTGGDLSWGFAAFYHSHP